MEDYCMDNRKKLAIDMDDVIVTGGFLYLINQFLGTSYTEADFKEFYMQDILPNKEQFFRWFATQNMYDHCTLTPHADEVLRELNEAYQVRIITSYIFPEIVNQSGHILQQKFDYLREHLPFITPYQYIFTWDKSFITDIKIDDKPSNLVNASRKLLFSAYHNHDISESELAKQGIERVENWDEVKVKLLSR